MLFKFDNNNNEIVQLKESTFSAEKLTELQNIEKWIRKNPSILSEGDEEDLRIIGEQITSKTRKRIDLLGVDKFGDIVIIEIKRDLAEKMTEFQAITYASSLVYTNFDEANKIYAEYLEKNKEEMGQTDTIYFLEKAEEDLSKFLSLINIAEDFNRNQRIILIAGEFSEDLLSAVTWLILKDIKIECVKLELYKEEHSGELFIYPKKILPTPEISENIIKIKTAEEKSEIIRSKYQNFREDIEEHYKRLEAPLGDYLRDFVNELSIEPTNLSGSGFHIIKGEKKIIVSTYPKRKIEFRFPKSKKEEIEKLLNDLNITSFSVKEKADIEAYGLENPTPSIDYKEDNGLFEDIKNICRKWLEL